MSSQVALCEHHARDCLQAAEKTEDPLAREMLLRHALEWLRDGLAASKQSKLCAVCGCKARAWYIEAIYDPFAANDRALRRVGLCAAMRDRAGSTAARAASCRKFRRGSFILNLPLASHRSITSSARRRQTDPA